MAKPKKQEEEINVLRVNEGSVEFCVLGTTPLILNRMSEKAKRELLLPRKKTAADKAANLKHDPFAEFRASAYLAGGDQVPTRLLTVASAFKKALSSAALDIPGAAKAQIARLTWVQGDYLCVYGLPRLFMAVVRSADMNRTPDVRTRAIVPAWAARLTIAYATPMLREQAVANLLAAAGIMRGVGDWRPEKGAGSYGKFELVSEDDPRFLEVLRMGREAQDEALAHPEPYDAESAEMLTWFTDEAERRGFKVA